MTTPLLCFVNIPGVRGQRPRSYPANNRSPCVTSARTASRNPGSSPALRAATIKR
jgi:hypothetical protein